MGGEVNSEYLSLIKLGIGHKAEIPSSLDWKTVFEVFGERDGVVGV